VQATPGTAGSAPKAKSVPELHTSMSQPCSKILKIICLALVACVGVLPCRAQTVTLPIIEVNKSKDGIDMKKLPLTDCHQANAMFLLSQGKNDEAAKEAETGLEEAKKGSDRQVIISCYCVLGKVYRRQDRYQESLNAYQQALDYWNKQEPGENWLAAMVLNNIGEEYRAMGRLDKALSTLLEAKARTRESAPDYCAIVENLGAVYLQQNKLAEAEESWKKAVEAAHTGFDNRSEVDSLSNLGLLYLRRGQLNDSKSMLDKALSLSEVHFGPAAPRTAQLKKLQEVIQKQLLQVSQFEAAITAGRNSLKSQDYPQAISNFEAAVKVVEAAAPGGSPSTVLALGFLGRSYNGNKQYKEAVETLTKAITLYKKLSLNQVEILLMLEIDLKTAQENQAQCR
jgi:tetratricopeptide (TPR) repeat protein